MRFRKLRIAWSVACGILCVLLIVLWVRGLGYEENFVWQPTATYTVGVESTGGRLSYTTWNHGPFRPDEASTFIYERHDLGDVEADLPLWGRDSVRSRPDFQAFSLPTWFVTLVAAIVSIAPLCRLSFQFSLRTLLFATTLVAVVLGLIVWLNHH